MTSTDEKTMEAVGILTYAAPQKPKTNTTPQAFQAPMLTVDMLTHPLTTVDSTNTTQARMLRYDDTEYYIPPFLRLPKELREMVYDELWQDTPNLAFHAPSINTNVGSSYGTHATSERITAQDLELGMAAGVQKPPRWLQTSKTFMTEGVEQYFRKTRMTYFWDGGVPQSAFDVSRASPLRLFSGIGPARYRAISAVRITYDEFAAWLNHLARDMSKSEMSKAKELVASLGMVSSIRGVSRFSTHCCI